MTTSTSVLGRLRFRLSSSRQALHTAWLDMYPHRSHTPTVCLPGGRFGGCLGGLGLAAASGFSAATTGSASCPRPHPAPRPPRLLLIHDRRRPDVPGAQPRQVLAAAHEVQHGARARALEVLDERAGAAAEGLGRVDALGAEVAQAAVVGVQHDLLLVGVLERLAAAHARGRRRGGGAGGRRRGRSAAAGEPVTMEVARERRGRSPRRTGDVSLGGESGEGRHGS